MTKSMDEHFEFQYVEKRSNKKLRKRNNKNVWLSGPVNVSLQSIEHTRDQMNKYDYINLSKLWFLECMSDRKKEERPRRIICLALGSFMPMDEHPRTPAKQSMKQSQYQLVFLLDVIIPILSDSSSSGLGQELNSNVDQNQKNTPPSDQISKEGSALSISFYDPAFNEKDKERLRELNCIVLDKEPNFCCREVTFFYMPHAPKTLYERLLSENSSSKSENNLNHVMLLGNDLMNYQRIMIEEEKSSIPFLMQIDHKMIRAHYPPDLTKLNQESGVYFFNETCLQWFKKS